MADAQPNATTYDGARVQRVVPPVAVANPQEPEVAVFPLRVEPVEVMSHRRIHKHRKGQFVQLLATEIKAKLGTPARTPANVLAVRHLAHARCREVNLRAIDTRRAVEQAIELVFLPDDADIEAAKIRNSRSAHAKRSQLEYQRKSALFRMFVSEETYVRWSWAPGEAHGIA